MSNQNTVWINYAGSSDVTTNAWLRYDDLLGCFVYEILPPEPNAPEVSMTPTLDKMEAEKEELPTFAAFDQAIDKGLELLLAKAGIKPAADATSIEEWVEHALSANVDETPPPEPAPAPTTVKFTGTLHAALPALMQSTDFDGLVMKVR